LANLKFFFPCIIGNFYTIFKNKFYISKLFFFPIYITYYYVVFYNPPTLFVIKEIAKTFNPIADPTYN